MQLEGSLQAIGLLSLLQQISALEKTGILTVQSENDIIAVTFLEGAIVSADALNEPMEEGLGQVLMSQGLISQERFSEAVGHAKASGVRLAGLLISQRILGREQVLQAVRLQTYRLLLQLVRWTQGDFNLFVGDEISYEDGIKAISVEEFLVRSVGDIGKEGPIQGPLPDLDDPFDRRADARSIRVLGRHGDDPSGQPSEVWLSANEAAILARIDGRRPGTTLILDTGLDEYQVRYALYRLVKLGLAHPGRRMGTEQVASTGMRPVLRVDGHRGSAPAGAPAPVARRPESGRLVLDLDEALRDDVGGRNATAATPDSPAAGSMLDTGSFALERTPPPGATGTLPRAVRASEPLGGFVDAWLGRAMAFGLLLLLALVLPLSSERNRVLFHYPWQEARRLGFEAAQRSTIVRKVDGAVRIYYLLYGRFPEQLGILTDLELLQPPDLRDPRGRVLEYSSTETGYRLSPLEGGVSIPQLESVGSIEGDFLLNPAEVQVTSRRRPLVLLD